MSENEALATTLLYYQLMPFPIDNENAGVKVCTRKP